MFTIKLGKCMDLMIESSKSIANRNQESFFKTHIQSKYSKDNLVKPPLFRKNIVLFVHISKDNSQNTPHSICQCREHRQYCDRNTARTRSRLVPNTLRLFL